MDFVTLVTSILTNELTVGAILLGVVVLIITGVLVPLRTHKRELAASNARADEWKAAYDAQVLLTNKAVNQNSVLLAGVRIADKFYKDFLPAIPEEESHVVE